jgi:peptide/nickel transport system permease protein
VFMYIVRRLLAGIPVLVGVSLITFILMHVVPGDPVTAMLQKRADQATIDRMRHEMGLDRPLPVQYADFVAKAAVGDLGQSFRTKQPVTQMIVKAMPTTIRLTFWSMGVALLLGVPFGVAAALRQNTWVDYVATITTLSFISAPVFWVAILAQIFFGLKLDLLPISGYEGWQYMIMPATVLGSRYAASIARYTRSSMLDVLNQEYVRTARAKGLAQRVVVWKHALRNAMVPLLTVIGLELGGLLTGSILIESLFGLPGLGQLTVQGLNFRDFPMIQGNVLFTATIFVLSNMLVDIGYAAVDPRIRVA